MTEAQADVLARRSYDYRARKIRGQWVVWSRAADHAVEFDDVQLARAAKVAEAEMALDDALNAHFNKGA